MIKCAVISYHKNISKIYPKEWIDKYRDSILRQTYKSFDIYELNYGAGYERIFQSPYYQSKSFPTFVHGMNFMLEHLFSHGYDYVFNTNVDDYYAPERIERQLMYLNKGYDLVSSNFALIEEDKEVHRHRFSGLDIARELRKGHNIIAHPVVAYSKRFWNSNKYVPEEIPREDLMLWQRAVHNCRFIVMPDCLLFHRLHESSVCKSQNR